MCCLHCHCCTTRGSQDLADGCCCCHSQCLCKAQLQSQAPGQCLLPLLLVVAVWRARLAAVCAAAAAGPAGHSLTQQQQHCKFKTRSIHKTTVAVTSRARNAQASNKRDTMTCAVQC
jgi:hypothetical protein